MSTSHGPSYPALRQKAIESLLIEKGYLTAGMVDATVDAFERDIGPARGAAVVAKAWTDPAFKRRLLDDATAAMNEIGVGGLGAETVVALENTDRVHNAVVCTLCSCYPLGVLGLPPKWYKSPEYRSRIVREPRAVLEEFGLALSPDVAVKVWDSSSEIRYLVLPRRPEGSDGMGEEELAALVTRDSMIGTGAPAEPAR